MKKGWIHVAVFISLFNFVYAQAESETGSLYIALFVALFLIIFYFLYKLVKSRQTIATKPIPRVEKKPVNIFNFLRLNPRVQYRLHKKESQRHHKIQNREHHEPFLAFGPTPGKTKRSKTFLQLNWMLRRHKPRRTVFSNIEDLIALKKEKERKSREKKEAHQALSTLRDIAKGK